MVTIIDAQSLAQVISDELLIDGDFVSTRVAVGKYKDYEIQIVITRAPDEVMGDHESNYCVEVIGS